MITAFNFDDRFAAHVRARQSQRVHRGFRARVAEAHLLNGRETPLQFFCQVDHVGAGQRIEAAFAKLIAQRFYQHGVRMTDQQAAEGQVEVSLLVAIKVPDLAAFGATDK